MRSLVDPRLKTAMPEHWPSKCTIQRVVVKRSESNQPIGSYGFNLTGMVDIPCRISALSTISPDDDETRDSAVESKYRRRTCKLNGNFPDIISRFMQAVVDGETWQIRSVESDSQSFSTRLRLENVIT